MIKKLVHQWLGYWSISYANCFDFPKSLQSLYKHIICRVDCSVTTGKYQVGRRNGLIVYRILLEPAELTIDSDRVTTSLLNLVSYKTPIKICASVEYRAEVELSARSWPIK